MTVAQLDGAVPPTGATNVAVPNVKLPLPVGGGRRSICRPQLPDATRMGLELQVGFMVHGGVRTSDSDVRVAARYGTA